MQSSLFIFSFLLLCQGTFTFPRTFISTKYEKQDQQIKAAFNEHNLHTTHDNRQGAQQHPKQKQDRAQGKARTGYWIFRK
jgi:hypothetical protein